MLAKQVYQALGPRFRKQGFRVAHARQAGRVLVRDDGTHLRLFEFSLQPRWISIECGVSFPAVDRLLEPVSIHASNRTRSAMLATLPGWIDHSLADFRRENVQRAPGGDPVEIVWSGWQLVQPWLERASDPRVALEIHQTSARSSMGPPAPPHTISFNAAMALALTLGEKATAQAELEALAAHFLGWDPGKAGRDMPEFWAYHLLQAIVWAREDLGLVLADLESVLAWCKRCLVKGRRARRMKLLDKQGNLLMPALYRWEEGRGDSDS